MSPAEIVTFCKAVAFLDVDDVTDLYWSGRTCLVSEHRDIQKYDAAFAAFFLGSGPELLSEGVDDAESPPGGADRSDSASAGERSTFVDEADSGGENSEGQEGPEPGSVASFCERLRHRSFSEWTEEELASLAGVIAEIRIRVPRRTTRRLRPAATAGRLDLRRTVRRSLRNEGETLQRLWRRRVTEPRRLVFLIDVSGSMSTHSRAMLHLGYGLVTGDVRTEVFCFGTRLTRTTELLGGRDPDRAVERASDGVVDWAGGTRIGESLALLLRDPTGYRVTRGALVLIASDGLEIGEPQLMASQTARLSRLAYSVVWMSPLKADPSYRPLTRGMRLALPYVDHLVAADSVSDLEKVAKLIPGLVSTASSR